MKEPASPEAVEAWIAAASDRFDRFTNVRTASVAHREEHGLGCTVFPTRSGPLLGVLAAAVAARRLLEVGTGLGYSALWLAFGAGPDAHVETIEMDPLHAELARRNLAEHGFDVHVKVHEGRALDSLSGLSAPYDLVFCDADPEQYEALLDEFLRLLRPWGLLISANLFLAQFATDIPHLDQIARYRKRIVEDDRLLTSFVPGGMALSVVR